MTSELNTKLLYALFFNKNNYSFSEITRLYNEMEKANVSRMTVYRFFREGRE